MEFEAGPKGESSIFVDRVNANLVDVVRRRRPRPSDLPCKISSAYGAAFERLFGRKIRNSQGNVCIFGGDVLALHSEAFEQGFGTRMKDVNGAWFS